MSHAAAPQVRRPRPWSAGEIQQLARTPSARHDCPVTPGFFMRVSPKLRSVWAYRFKHDGREITGTLAPVLTPLQPTGLAYPDALARFYAIHERETSTRRRFTLSEAYTDWLKNHRNRRTGGPIVGRTRQTYERLYSYNLARLGHLVLEETPPITWRDALQSIRARAPHQARQCFMLLHSIHGHLVDLKELPENPLKSLGRAFNGKDLKVKRTRLLPLEGLPAWFRAVGQLKRSSRDAPTVVALTGWRMMAVLKMRWSELDLEAGTYTVPPGGEGWKGYVGVVALSEQVRALLAGRRQGLQGAGQLGEWVFPARHGDKGHQVDISSGVRIAGEAAGVRLSPHDLRRTWTTAAHLAGVDPLTVDRLTGRATRGEGAGPGVGAGEGLAEGRGWGSVAAGYVIQQIKADRAAASKVAGLLLELGGVAPLSERVRALMEERGLELPEGLGREGPAEGG